MKREACERFTAMRHSIASSVLVQVTAAQILLLGVGAGHAAARFHHHHASAVYHGAQAAISSTGSPATNDLGRNGTGPKRDGKDKSNASTGAETPPVDEANTKGQKAPNNAPHGDDHSSHGDDHNKSAAPELGPIDTSITTVGPARVMRGVQTHGWRTFKGPHGFGKLSGGAKALTQENKTVAKGKIFTRSIIKNRVIRNAIGQKIIQASADPNGHLVRKGDPPAVNGIHRLATDPTGPGVMAIVAPAAHPKPLVPLAWSLGRPHDPPAGATPYRAEIDGFGMIRVGTGTAAIGGSANLNSGVLSGSSFHPKPR
jgi:hypothetical protein